jgi:hypothetical protein
MYYIIKITSAKFKAFPTQYWEIITIFPVWRIKKTSASNRKEKEQEDPLFEFIMARMGSPKTAQVV